MIFSVNFSFDQGSGLILRQNLRGLGHTGWANFQVPCPPRSGVDICHLMPVLHPFSLPYTNCDHPWGVTPALLLLSCGREEYSDLGDCLLLWVAEEPDCLSPFVNRNGESAHKLDLVQRAALFHEMKF